jgi:hypothetical protein
VGVVGSWRVFLFLTVSNRLVLGWIALGHADRHR